MKLCKHDGQHLALQVSPQGIETAKKVLRNYSLTQKSLAEKELKINSHTIKKFFQGKPIDPKHFYKICEKLNLKWHDIVLKQSDQSELSAVRDIGSNIDSLVQEVRQKSRADIMKQCGTMQVLDMTQPLGLNDIYVSVNILETITGHRQLEISELLQNCDPTDFNRFGLARITLERIPGLTAVENYSKLMVLGKPGVGKTTFLKYLALQYILDEFGNNKIPLFITLKDYAEAENQPSLLIYINQLFQRYNVADEQTLELLKHGRAIILLDGLDEVKQEHSSHILQQIHDFCQQFDQNQFVITCRIAGREYSFEHFTEVEVADFDIQQITSFAIKWFALTDLVKSNKFIQKLKENEPLQELATNPLLLTLLCLVFEESAEFPSSRSQLYKEGLNLLLRKWDANQNIERFQVYKNLSVHHKQDLLSQIALKTFERCEYFFRQKEIEQHISDYIRHLPGINNDLETLQIDSKAVLKSIECQHGLLVERARFIYSFSHLTFQEYFTTRQIVGISEPQALEAALKTLVSRITEKRWREVFLLSVGMLRNADYLLQLMKQQIDQRIVAQDEQLQVFLKWANQKSCAVTVPYKPVAVRSFYLAIARTLILVNNEIDIAKAVASASDTLEIAFSLDPTLTLNSSSAYDLSIDRALILALARAIELNRINTCDVGIKYFIIFVRSLAPEPDIKPKRSPLAESLRLLTHQLPDPDQGAAKLQEWWQANGRTWTEQLRSLMISERNIGHDWQFSEQQLKTLNNYYDANCLLMCCLNSDGYVTRAVREEIEETLFLPAVEIETAKNQSFIAID
ncbi:MAG: NACHT domain-containing NTPase [Gloeocapsa sp. UFS-A4-WI-NPMV-4B04]|jgi:predicted NACHT family NTPase|nr:NACHT domain-containing NTPase [Gloeocapsa sp. UFS-A4-WI-NPMV-4B04]